MQTYISLLRGINVSGQKKIRMANLKSLYESLGLAYVQTYVQSGNVVFDSDEEEPEKLRKSIEDQIEKAYGFSVPVLLPRRRASSVSSGAGISGGKEARIRPG